MLRLEGTLQAFQNTNFDRKMFVRLDTEYKHTRYDFLSVYYLLYTVAFNRS